MNTTTSLIVQSWTFYALAVSIIFARLVFRRIMLKSFTDLQADDWIMVFLILPFTASTVFTTLVTNPKTQGRTYRYVLEELRIVTAWLVKACLLVLYWRIFPVASNILRRRYVQVASIVCALSFIVVQISLFSWCQPSAPDSDKQCLIHHNHIIVSLTLSILTTLLVLILPTPFIPTPRHFLLAILMTSGVSILVLDILARYSVLNAPESQGYLFFYTSESTLLIVFANLPFLTSLVVSTAPARIREFGRNISFSRDSGGIPLSPWPRSRRVSVQSIGLPPLRASRLGSMVTVMSGEGDIKDGSCEPYMPALLMGSGKHNVDMSRAKGGPAERGWPLC